jgi:deoxycytidine triphosphate deaminase
MSVLSDRDIVRNLGRGILIYPFKPESVKACRVCLTASEYAYAIGKKQRLIIQTEQKVGSSGQEQKFFYIPAKDTALIWSDESIHFNRYFCGSIHSRVGLASQGTGHLGTTVNPGWSGVLCIAIHNLSDNPIRINVKDVDVPIAYLVVYKLSSESLAENKDTPGRLDLLKGFPNRSEIDDWFNDRSNKWMVGDTNLLEKKLKDSETYRKIKRSAPQSFILQYVVSEPALVWTFLSVLIALLSLIVTTISLWSSRRDSNDKQPQPAMTTAPKSKK